MEGQQTASQFNFPGVPLADPRKEQTIRDRREDPRVPCKGKIRIVQQSWAAPFRGKLIDISPNGFRVSFAQRAPAAGAEVEFRHRLFRGRARVVWITWKDNHYEAGCKVLRD
jgi:PilZ domain